MRFHVEMKVTPPDWDKFEEEMEKEIDQGLQQFTDRIEEIWRDKAEKMLKTTKNEYLKGLQVEKTSEGASATLSGFLPVALEKGTPSWDMKKTHLGDALFKIIPIGAKKSENIPPKDFAIMSQNSPLNSWIHPGFKGINIGEEIKSEVPEIVDEIFGPLLKKVKT